MHPATESGFGLNEVKLHARKNAVQPAKDVSGVHVRAEARALCHSRRGVVPGLGSFIWTRWLSCVML